MIVFGSRVTWGIGGGGGAKTSLCEKLKHALFKRGLVALAYDNNVGLRLPKSLRAFVPVGEGKAVLMSDV